MKIKGRCRRCDREVLIEQVIEGGGVCPWDGRPLQEDYAVVLVDSLRDAQSAGSDLEAALEKIADLAPDLDLDADSILTDLRASLDRLARRGG